MLRIAAIFLCLGVAVSTVGRADPSCPATLQKVTMLGYDSTGATKLRVWYTVPGNDTLMQQTGTGTPGLYGTSYSTSTNVNFAQYNNPTNFIRCGYDGAKTTYTTDVTPYWGKLARGTTYGIMGSYYYGNSTCILQNWGFVTIPVSTDLSSCQVSSKSCYIGSTNIGQSCNTDQDCALKGCPSCTCK